MKSLIFEKEVVNVFVWQARRDVRCRAKILVLPPIRDPDMWTAGH